MGMVRKRRNNGRSKRNKGHIKRVHCDGSKALVPRDKAIKKLIIKNTSDINSLKEIKKSFILPNYKTPKLKSFIFYSITYAFSKKIVKSRSKNVRRCKNKLI